MIIVAATVLCKWIWQDRLKKTFLSRLVDKKWKILSFASFQILTNNIIFLFLCFMLHQRCCITWDDCLTPKHTQPQTISDFVAKFFTNLWCMFFALQIPPLKFYHSILNSLPHFQPKYWQINWPHVTIQIFFEICLYLPCWFNDKSRYIICLE